jgi:hypothetical protein
MCSIINIKFSYVELIFNIRYNYVFIYDQMCSYFVLSLFCVVQWCGSSLLAEEEGHSSDGQMTPRRLLLCWVTHKRARSQ